MSAKKKFVAIIPARGGSKGLKDKNIKTICGRPLIAWSIKAADESQYIEKIIVSTDSEKIAEISANYGAQVPFLRPASLATDNASSHDVIIHALDFLNTNREFFDKFILLQPTSPLRIVKDIDDSILEMKQKGAKAIISVSEAIHHPLWTNILPEDRNMKNFLKPQIKDSPRQNLPIYYQLNGAIFLAETDYYRKKGGFFGEKTFAFIMPRERSIDIDTNFDFQIASFLLEKSLQNRKK